MQTESLSSLRERILAIEARLLDGDARIGAVTALGQDVGAWEDFWISLLRQYETLSEEFANELAESLSAA